jgi:tol-pal system protein YbgF
MEETKPTPTQIYGAAYTDYTMKNYDLAVEGFKDYMSEYPNGLLVPNAQFWIGICYYEKDDFKNAVEAFDKLIKAYPESEKTPSAELKTAYALQKLDRDADANDMFEKIVNEHPKTPEARQAASQLSGHKKQSKKKK